MLTYSELLRQNNILAEENKNLKREISELKTKLGIVTLPKKDTQQSQSATVTMQSSVKDKIALFRSLFSGREDVFARRWYSKTTGKTATSLFAQTNGLKAYAIRKSINAPLARIASFYRLKTAIFSPTLQEKTIIAEMLSEFIRCSLMKTAVFCVLILMKRISEMM